ncbi:DUF2079 domain-containing protein [Synechococcus sp. R60.4]|uniref:DUF2079 domain-containing protein n=1 Tax=unclassified Synechococcus TaxID=2626047 RepID=UPI0039C4399D
MSMLAMLLCAFLALLSCSVVRHHLFQSGGYDLGIFDQSIYLISRGEVPFSTIRGIHILGDHAAFILYPISLLYRIVPSVYWLFGIQALALTLGALAVYHLALQAEIDSGRARTIAAAYLLYPAIFNANLFDFHPEVLAVPLFLAAILCVRSGKLWGFLLCLGGILGCKAALSLNVAALGVWLLIWESRRIDKRWQRRCQVAGWLAIAAGSAWFGVATFWIIPHFSGSEPAAVSHYSYLGSSVPEIIQNLVLKPTLVLGKVFSLDTLFYGFLLVIPVAWGLSWRHWDPWIPALPTLGLNILSSNPAYRDLVHQYALPVVPFLFLAVIENGKTTNPPASSAKVNKTALIWSLLAFLALAKYTFFGSLYLQSLDTWQATREALAQIATSGGVLTTHEISPHLTHRRVIYFTDESRFKGSPPDQWDPFDYVLLNSRHPGWRSSPEFSQTLIAALQNETSFRLLYHRDGVYLFSRLRERS